MRVLMVNTPDSLRFRGGDLTQMRKTAAALQPMGVEVAESFDSRPDARGYDVAHIFNLRTLAVTPGQLQSLKQYGIPVVMSPIYLNPAYALWGTRVTRQLFAPNRTEEELRQFLPQFAAGTLKVNQQDGTVLASNIQNRPRPDYDDMQRRMLRSVDYLLPNSHLEMDALIKALRVCDIPFTVVPYAADPAIFLDPDPDLFTQAHGLRDFILQVGRIEPSKNQVMLCRAMRESPLPLVLIGGQLQPDYRDMCRRFGPMNLHMIEHLPPEQLRSAYAAARVHVLPSWIETCGLVTMEAALASCNVVASIAGYEVEYYRDYAYYCDPADTVSIRNAIQRAFDNYDRDGERRQALKELILQEYTWERAAQRTLRGYQHVLQR